MRIAIVGAGNVGRAQSAAAVAVGHDVAVSATTRENAEEAAAAAGARAAVDNADAVNGATNGWAWQSGWKLVGPTGEQ
jgi:3-hydroxyisobutyrate dehydrogenase-like beta-hydroxyacid dehydrogenase